MKNKFLFTVACFAAISLTFAQVAHPWQMFHHDAQHAGYANVTGPQTATLKWSYNLGAVGMEGGNSVAVSRTGTIYVAGPNKITALDRNGNFKWSKPYQNAQGPCISNSGTRIYIVSNRNIVSLDTMGNQVWSYMAGDTMIFGGTLSANDSVFYVGCWDKYIYAINTWNGTLKWRYLTFGSVSYPPTIATDGSIVVGGGDAHRASDSTVYALNPNGTLKWRYFTNAISGAHCGSPAIGPDGMIYEPAQPTLYVFDNNGGLSWSDGSFASEISGIISPAISPDTTIYIGSNQGKVFAINGTTHATKWTYQTGPDPMQTNFYGVISFPVVDRWGTVYVGAVDHKIYALDKNGNLKWSYTTGGRISEASPAFDSDGTLYITSADGYLYAFFDTLTLGINSPEQIENSITVFPNPNNGVFTVSATKISSNEKIEIYNSLGEIIQSENITLENTSIDISGEAAGIYFYRVISNGVMIATGKLITE